MCQLFVNWNQTAVVLISLFLILSAGFLMTRITKRLGLPNVSGFILAGVLIGPSMLDLIPHQQIAEMGFISDLALSFIAFDVGRFFKKDVLKAAGKKILVITLLESLLAGAAVFLFMRYLFGMNAEFSMLLGAIATATAPASTMMTINQYHARGEFVNTLLQVVALDDVACLLVFSVVTSLISARAAGTLALWDLIGPLLYNLLALLLGLVCGLMLCRLLSVPTRSQDNRIILVVAMLLGISGLCTLVNVSPLLSCMVLGATYLNCAHDKELYHQIKYFTPPVMSLFFIVSGMNLNMGALRSFGLIGVGYFLIRIIGKYLGAFAGCALTHSPKPIRNYLGMALIPQAGVAIGLAFLGQRMLPPEIGDVLLTIILSSSVLYELIGPACAKAALVKSGVIVPEAKPQPDLEKTTRSQQPPTQKILCVGAPKRQEQEHTMTGFQAVCKHRGPKLM